MLIVITPMLEPLQIIQTTKYLHISSAALLLADWILTLDAEVAYVWRASWNLGRVLFFLTRYPTFVVTGINLYYELGHSIPVPTCLTLSRTIETMSYFGTLFAEAILTMRVWALWGRHLSVGAFLATTFVACSLLGGLGHGLSGAPHTIIAMDNVVPTMPGCFTIYTSHGVEWATIALMIHVNIIFVMTMAAGIQHYREGVYGGSSLIYTFYEDGIIYYMVLLAFSIIYTAMVHTKYWVLYSTFLLSIQRTVNSILSSRMVLHLYEETAPPQETGKLTSIQFAPVDPGVPAQKQGVSTSETTIYTDIWFEKDSISRQGDLEA